MFVSALISLAADGDHIAVAAPFGVKRDVAVLVLDVVHGHGFDCESRDGFRLTVGQDFHRRRHRVAGLLPHRVGHDDRRAGLSQPRNPTGVQVIFVNVGDHDEIGGFRGRLVAHRWVDLDHAAAVFDLHGCVHERRHDDRSVCRVDGRLMREGRSRALSEGNGAAKPKAQESGAKDGSSHFPSSPGD